MMGADGPRSYFMGFQTNAEARGTGGLLGGFGILRFDNGTATVDRLGRNSELDKAFTPLDLGTEFITAIRIQQAHYRFPERQLRVPTSRMRPNLEVHVGTAIRTTVDGAIAIDPVALSYILGAVGSVTMPDGETITKDNVVELTESTAYIRFADDNDARKAYLQDVASAVVEKMTGQLGLAATASRRAGKAVGEGRIAVWSASPDEQKLIEETPLAHLVPDDPAPYASVIINNLAGTNSTTT